MKQLIIIENVFESESWIHKETDNVCESLLEHFKVWPEGARLYNGQVSLFTDITPITEIEVEKVNNYDGPFYAVVVPGEPITLAIIAVVALVAVVAFLPKPKIPTVAQRNTQNTSPNNDLSSRANKERPNSRIPDIFGTVRAIPDLLAVPYSIYVDHQERIYDYMCIGRGSYDIVDIRDAQTKISQIYGAAVEIYDPFHSPNDGVIKQSIGDPINEKVLNVSRSKSVNGQVLLAPNDAGETNNYTNEIVFVFPNKIQSINNTINFLEKYSNLSKKFFVHTQNHRNCDGCYMFNFSGSYTLSAVTATEITLSNPVAVSDSWRQLEFESASNGNNGAYGIPGHIVSLGLVSNQDNWIGPFTIDQPTLTGFIANFVNQNGMYKDDGKEQKKTSVDIEIGITPIGVSGLPSGNESFYSVTVEGSESTKSSRAATIKQDVAFTGRMAVRARRITPKDYEFDGQISDEVKWRDLYGVSPVNQLHFGDVTTVQSVTFATENALSLSQRELNMLVTRKLPYRVSGSTFSTELMATTNVADILCAIALDSKIGNRKIQELNVAQIYDTISEVSSYFGTSKAIEFCHTFDTDNITFEETAAAIADAAFCQAFRRGSIINLSFEKLTDNPILIFNHRNKVPESETRTITFGQQNDNDGLEYKYISPEDDALITYYIPQNQSAVNPKKVESLGIRNHRQAHFHAWRMFNRLRYQNLLVEFTALQESFIVQRNDKVLVADNTRPTGKDGEVVSQSGLIIELSQKHNMVNGTNYVIYLQHVDASVEIIDVTAGADDYHVVLGSVPTLPLSLDEEASVKAAYYIMPDTDTTDYACLIEEREPNDNFTCVVKAINYSEHYYDNDKDYINGIIQ